MQVTNCLLIELLGQHTSPDAAVTAASASAAPESAPLQNNQAEYADAGLAELAASDECMTLQSSILRCIMLTTEHPQRLSLPGEACLPHLSTSLSEVCAEQHGPLCADWQGSGDTAGSEILRCDVGYAVWSMLSACM